MAANRNMPTAHDITKCVKEICDQASWCSRQSTQLYDDFMQFSTQIEKELIQASRNALKAHEYVEQARTKGLDSNMESFRNLVTNEAAKVKYAEGVERGFKSHHNIFDNLKLLPLCTEELSRKCNELTEKVNHRFPLDFEVKQIAKKFIDSQPVRLHLIMQQVVFLILIYLVIGVLSFSVHQDFFTSVGTSKTGSIVDGLYFMVATLTTVGFGDFAPMTKVTKIVVIIEAILGAGLLILFNILMNVLLKRLEDTLVRIARKWSSIEYYLVNVSKGKFKDWLKILVAIVTISLFIGIGALLMLYLEDKEWLDSLYFSVISVLTIGYGDEKFEQVWGRILGSVWLLFGTVLVSRSFSFLFQLLIDRKQEHSIQSFVTYLAGDPEYLKELVERARRLKQY